MEKFFIDRIEGDVVICEDENGNEVKFGLENLPKSVREGHVILLENGGLSVSSSETENRRKNICDLKKRIYGTKK